MDHVRVRALLTDRRTPFSAQNPIVVRIEESMETTIPEIRVAIPRALRAFCGNQGESRHAELRLIGNNVRDLLAELARQYPQVHIRVCDEQGEPRRHINVFVNDDHIRMLAGLDTPLAEGDLVTILPAVSGG